MYINVCGITQIHCLANISCTEKRCLLPICFRLSQLFLLILILSFQTNKLWANFFYVPRFRGENSGVSCVNFCFRYLDGLSCGSRSVNIWNRHCPSVARRLKFFDQNFIHFKCFSICAMFSAHYNFFDFISPILEFGGKNKL
jgi:hypothetical protein